MENIDSFLASVDEFVDDESKIVTYKWLSLQLALHVNQAKKVLKAYAEGNKNKETPLNIVYTVIGRDSDGVCVKVVQDSELDSMKDKLQQILSTSIYSVQKAKLPSSSLLYTADYDSNRECLHENSRFGGISYDGAKRLTKEEIKEKTPSGGAVEPIISASKKPTQAKPEKSKTPQQKSNFFSKAKTSPTATKVKTETEAPVPSKEPKVSPPATATVEKKKKKATGVQSFMTKGRSDPFANSLTKVKKPVKKEPEDGSKEPVVEKPKEKKKVKVKNEPVVDDDDIRIDDFPLEDDDFLSETKKTKKEESKENKRKASEGEEVKKEKKTKSQPKASKSKKNSRHDSNELPAQKRRRIQVYLSSSSEDEDQEMEEEAPPTPPPPVVEPEKEASPEKKVKNVSNGKKNKLKKKVMKTKNFVDEDGFMITEKSMEYVSCSSEDDESPVAEGNVTKATEVEQKKFPLVSTAQQKKQTKQASIMGFFKKKS